ncbi:hypothetical protein [Nocardioides sp. AX2bis]|uniref:hypothetical protein n=1 Tax=Nocardioides sp. AX2bis TaxID=2653157 RepID=UPI0012F14845|nr:hypothetical protein [Nocardioides sp. AX2bis]VXB68405.1 exported hypothetical protein [Nocardioides sp. AX2bis]
MTRTTRSRTTAVALGLALAAGLTATTTSPAAAGALVTWSQSDPAGDTTFTGERGLTRAERRSIDATSVVTYDVADDRIQFNVTLREVTESRRFDQTVRVTFLDRRDDAVGGIVFSPSPGEQGSGVAVLGTGADKEVCRGLRTEFVEGTESDTTLTPVPDRCIPTARVRVRVVTSTGNLRGDGKVHSRDRVVSDGLVRVRPADAPAG